ncbi:UDP-N-acetylmuramate--L-alanine ligase [Deinococcus peraridilitoris]|nr:UDP-N-acetylmuramate--L-alanine ligase [Deinococcus peraridilitoris]
MHTTRYHLMGIGGIGVSALARLLKAQGFDVTGCDTQPSELTEQLHAEGIPVAIGHDAAHVAGMDILVASNAVASDDPELRAARAAGVRVQRRMELLGDLMRTSLANGAGSVGVVGTHGKTTTTSMIAVTLAGAGLDPAAFVGGIVPEFAGNARVGTGPFVAEVDESDPDFQFLTCDTAVVTNAEDDHVGTPDDVRATYWASVEEQHAAFARFAASARRVLYCADWPGLAELVTGREETLSYGTREGSDYRAVDIERSPSNSRFSVLRGDTRLGQVTLPLPGEHNILNSLAAVAVADLYGADFARVAAALAAFRGAGRRWQQIGELNGALVIDDYAHNPTKVAAALEGAQQTGRRVRVVFQPHRYLRTQQTWARLAQSLMNADEVLLLDIAAASETPIAGVHATQISQKMQQDGHTGVRYCPDREDVVRHLRETARPGDLIVTMGAGDVWMLSRQLTQAPAEANP